TTLGLPSFKPHEPNQSVTAPLPADATYTKWTARGSDPAEKLTGTDCDAYFVWRFAVEPRLQVDKPLYSITELQVRYAMQQLAQPIFPYVCSWFTSKQREGTPPSLPDLFQHIENYLGVSHLAAQVELQLDGVAQRANESVSAFYHRIQTLWDRASTPNYSRYRMLCRKLGPDITEPLKGWIIAQGTQRNLSALLDAACQAENLQHDINAFQRKDKSSYNTPYSNSNRSQYGAARHSQRDPPASDSPNAKLMPTATKPAGWTGQWFSPEQHPKKLTAAERLSLARQNRCWRCHGSGHRSHHEVCPRYRRKTNRPSAQVATTSTLPEKSTAQPLDDSNQAQSEN
ncbi:hypothetical protein KEM55_007433, partial [Ascosphaera atra]